MSITINLPPQQIPFSKKTTEWRKKHLDWADDRSYVRHDIIRNTVKHKKINYDLLDGILHMEDLVSVLNPDGLDTNYIPESIPHYPIMNSKLQVLIGEESKRIFDITAVVTNPNSLSEIEEIKKKAMYDSLVSAIQNTAQSDEEFQQEVQKLEAKFKYEWQDLREIRANELLKHYSSEQNFPLIFNSGFTDALAVGEEIYKCDIVGGEPVLERLNPMKVKVFKSGHSNRIEDADIITIEDYWSPAKIVDVFHEDLTPADRKYLEELALKDEPVNGQSDPSNSFVTLMTDEESWEETDSLLGSGDEYNTYDTAGNIRVLRVYWKSRRKVKKVKSYDPATGEEIYNLYPETYTANKDLGEEETVLYINEAWEGTKIGSKIYTRMRPRPIQYNKMSNPSLCHFGIIGSIYNVNDSKPYSMVDMMKRYNYLYDVIHDRLNKAMSRTFGKVIMLDLAKVPAGWNIDQWMYYAKVNGIAVVDSFKEGNIGAATGKIAGALNNASSGVIDAEFGNSIQQYINILEFIKVEMSEVVGITRQREGQISNRETVGGVERATLQSSHITERLFVIHEDVKRRALQCFLDTAKIALRGKSKKFHYITSDNSRKIMEIDGDEFAESDYGILVSSDSSVQELSQKLDMLAQAALQTQVLDFSTIMQLYSSASLAEKQYLVRKNEQEMRQRMEESRAQEQKMQQEALALQREQSERQEQLQRDINTQDNETKIVVAQIQANADIVKTQEASNNNDREKLEESARQFNTKLEFDKEKFAKEFELAKETLKVKRDTGNKHKDK